MMDDILNAALHKRKTNNALRFLSLPAGIDFSSNDYLGLGRSEKLSSLIADELASIQQPAHGSGGSRLLSGNTLYAESLENTIATYHGAEAGLIYNSGYDANIGLMSCMSTRHDLILYDELVHASIVDGIGLSLATSYKFKHNDLSDLSRKLTQANFNNIFIIVESVYSMDGDEAPLKELATLAAQYNAQLIVDEAHASGVIGPNGKGLVCDQQLENNCFARIHTFGKALGTHGAIVLGSKTLREYLINHSRSFIYTTALPLHSLVAIRRAYQLMEEATNEREQLHRLIVFFNNLLKDYPVIQQIRSFTPIQSIIIPGNDRVKAVATQLRAAGFDIRPILSPTVAPGTERLRICLHAYNTTEQLTQLVTLIHTFLCNP